MGKKLALLGVWILTVAACSSPAPGATARPDSASGAQQTPTQPPTQAATASPTLSSTLPPSDLPFTIDCSALPASRAADCQSFIATTRDVVYPIERAMTGVSLSQCYKEIHYTILPTDPGKEAGGYSTGPTITYNQKYSIDLAHRYDVHEILHSISTCAHALDAHIFHGMIMNAVFDRLGVHDAGYFVDRSAPDLNVTLENLLTQAKTSSGTGLIDLCIGILSRKMTIAYFDLSASAITALYRSTIPPLKNATPPDAKLTGVWAGYAPQVEALREALQRDFTYALGAPECGLP